MLFQRQTGSDCVIYAVANVLDIQLTPEKKAEILAGADWERAVQLGDRGVLREVMERLVPGKGGVVEEASYVHEGHKVKWAAPGKLSLLFSKKGVFGVSWIDDFGQMSRHALAFEKGFFVDSNSPEFGLINLFDLVPFLRMRYMMDRLVVDGVIPL